MAARAWNCMSLFRSAAHVFHGAECAGNKPGRGAACEPRD